MREFANIVLSKSDELTGLTFDADNFVNAESYRSSYNIPEDEKLLVYADSDRCTETLTGSGTFITDEAIYIHPAKKSWSKESRIPLSEICEFLIFENNNSEVKLLNKDSSYQIFATVKRRRNSAAADLVNLLQSLQDSLMIRKDKKQAYERVIKQIFLVMRRELSENGVLDENFLKIAEVMEKMSYIRQESIMLLLENTYRFCSKERYDLLLEEKKPLLNDQTIKVLENPEDIFYDAFIKDLSDKDSFKDVKAIIDAYLNLKGRPTLTLKEATILCYLCVRMDDNKYVEEVLEEISKDLTRDTAWSIRKIISRRKNLRLHRLLSKVAGKGDLLPEELTLSNDVGLSTLHYALILRNKEVIRYMLPLYDWCKYQTPCPKDRMVEAVFSPMFLASNIFDDEKLLLEIFEHTSPKASSIKRSIKGINTMLDINTALKEKYPEHMDEYEAKINEFKVVLSDMNNELIKLAKSEVKTQRELYKIIRESKHPLCDYILELFSSPDALISHLNKTEDEFKLYNYKNLFFVAGIDDIYDLNYCTWKNDILYDTNVSENENVNYGKIYDNPSFKAQREAERRQREEQERQRKEFLERATDPTLYPGSWFSEKAHENITALKEEYRVLVKKYHPDSSGTEKTAKIFLRIVDERADILERMAKKP